MEHGEEHCGCTGRTIGGLFLGASQSLGQAEGSDGTCRKRRLCREESGWGSGASLGPAGKDSGGLSCRGQMGPALGYVRRPWGVGLAQQVVHRAWKEEGHRKEAATAPRCRGSGSGRPEATCAPDVDQLVTTLPGRAEQRHCLSFLPCQSSPQSRAPEGCAEASEPGGNMGLCRLRGVRVLGPRMGGITRQY